MYDSIFPSSNAANERRDKTPMAHSVNGPSVHHGDEVLS